VSSQVIDCRLICTFVALPLRSPGTAVGSNTNILPLPNGMRHRSLSSHDGRGPSKEGCINYQKACSPNYADCLRSKGTAPFPCFDRETSCMQ
jgi:hypothetical protein